MVVFLAVARVRAIAAPLNAAYTEDEFKFYLEDANSTLLLVPGAEGNKAAEAAATTLNLPIAGVHWEKGSSGSGEIGLTPKAKLELGPEPEVRFSYDTNFGHAVLLKNVLAIFFIHILLTKFINVLFFLGWSWSSAGRR